MWLCEVRIEIVNGETRVNTERYFIRILGLVKSEKAVLDHEAMGSPL